MVGRNIKQKKEHFLTEMLFLFYSMLGMSIV